MGSNSGCYKSIWLGSCIVFFCGMVPMIGVPVAALIVASHPVSNCSAAALIPLTTWLDVYGAVTLGYLGLAAVCSIAVFYVEISKTIFIIALCAPIWVFHLIWSIVGAVSFFRDSSACETLDHPIWAMTLSALTVEWIVLPCVFVIKLAYHDSN